MNMAWFGIKLQENKSFIPLMSEHAIKHALIYIPDALYKPNEVALIVFSKYSVIPLFSSMFTTVCSTFCPVY